MQKRKNRNNQDILQYVNAYKIVVNLDMGYYSILKKSQAINTWENLKCILLTQRN